MAELMPPPHIGNRVDTRGGNIVVRERRDPSAATANLSWTSPGHPMIPEWDADTAIRWAFYANVIVYRCVQIRANTIASLPFLAGPRPPKRPGETAETVERSRLMQLLGPPPGGPAPRLSARRLWAWSVAQRIVTGRHAWEIELDAAKQIVALWPLVSSKLHAIPSTGGTDWFRAFEYGHRHDPRRLPADRVHYGWDPSLSDFRQPESVLQSARLDVSVAVMMDRYNVAFLKNDARPAAVVVTEQFAESEDFEAFKRQFRSEYGGPDNAGRTAFLEASGGDGGVVGAVDIKVLGLSQKDARFIETHKASLERIAISLGVPWSKLDASQRTFDNASEEDHAWWESTILPQLADLADEVNMGLAPRLGSEVGWFDTSGVRALQPPKQFQAVGAPSLITGGIATVNEARAMVGLEPIGDAGDQLIDIIALTQAAAGGPAPELEAAPELPALPAANTDDGRTLEGEVRHPHVDEPLDPETVAALHELRRVKIWKSADAQVRTLERQWERAWRSLFGRQGKAVIDRLTGKRGRQMFRRLAAHEQREIPPDVASLFDVDFWTAEARDISAALYEAVFAVGGARVSDLFGVAFDLEAPYAQAFITSRANQLAGPVTDTTYAAIQDALVKGVEAGDDIDALASRVRHVFDVASDSRARTIARTEVISAYNGSALTVAAQLPADVAAGQEWIATRDPRTREAHGSADGQVVAVGAPFVVAGEFLAYPGDPAGSAANTVNCRCTIALLTPEEMADRLRPVEKRAAEALLERIAAGDEIDELAWRRVLRGVRERERHPSTMPALARASGETTGGTTVNVTPPPVHFDIPDVHLPPPQVTVTPEIHVPPTTVTVRLPRAREKTIERDTHGNIVRIIEGDIRREVVRDANGNIVRIIEED